MKIEGHETHPAADLFPLIEGDEFAALVEDVRANGLREPIVRMWVDSGYGNRTRHALVLDGRNRLRACLAARVKPDWVDYEGEDPIAFVLSLNLRRRHLNESQRAMVAAKVATLNVGRPTKENAQTCAVSQAKAAEQLHVSRRTVQHAREVIDRGVPELREAVEQGKVAVSVAAGVAQLPEERQREVLERSDLSRVGNVRAITKQVRKRETAAQLEASPPTLPTGPFHVIDADIPWPYDREKELDYPTMTLEQVHAMPIQGIAAPDCVLWLWAPNAFVLRACAPILDAWGFEEKTILTWEKDRPGMGDYLRNITEHCILAVRGNPVILGEATTTILKAARREHSRKPDEFYELVARICPAPPGGRLILFGREARPGWTVWGAEPSKFEVAS